MIFGKKEKAMSEFEFAAAVLQEKHDRLSNPNTELAAKLRSTIGLLKYWEKMEQKTVRPLCPADFEGNPNVGPRGELASWQTNFWHHNGWQPVTQDCVEYYYTEDYTGVVFWTGKPTDEQIEAVLAEREKSGHIWSSWREHK